MTDCIIEHIVEAFRQETGIDVSGDAAVSHRLQEAAEKARAALASAPDAEVDLPFLSADATGPKHLKTRLRRTQFPQFEALFATGGGVAVSENEPGGGLALSDHET